MVIQDDNHFSGFDDFEARMLRTAVALNAEVVNVDKVSSSIWFKYAWQGSIALEKEIIEVFVDPEVYEIVSDSTTGAIRTWMLLNDMDSTGIEAPKAIPESVWEIRQMRWVTPIGV